MLTKNFENLLSATRSLSSNPILEAVKIDSLKEIELSSDSYVIETRKRMENDLKKMKIDYSTEHESFYDNYSEVTLYLYLKKKDINISRIHEKKNIKTPDFTLKDNNETYYIENKCVKPMNPKKNVKDFQYKVLNSLCKLFLGEKNQVITFGEIIEYQPYLPNNSTKYSSQSNLIVINSIIEKVNQNLKSGQINGNTILNIDLSLLGSNSIPTVAAFILDSQDDLIINAPLWTSCFGRVGMPIFKYDFAPNGNLEGYLEHNGILVSNEILNAISFRIDKFSDQSFYGGFVRTYHDNIQDILHRYCKEVNTDKNDNYLCLKQ